MENSPSKTSHKELNAIRKELIIGVPIHSDSNAGTDTAPCFLKAPNGVHLQRSHPNFSRQGKATLATCYSICYQVNNYDSFADESKSKVLIKLFQFLNTQMAVFILPRTLSFTLISLISLCYGFL